MGLGIELQDERGGVLYSLSDPKNLLSRLLPAGNDEAHSMLSAIDPYGDTTFNRLQMERFLTEWAAVLSKTRSSEERTLVQEIERLARRCMAEVHLYLKFIGD